MKALFCTSYSDDFISAVVWDGLQEVLGEENVSDAAFSPCLHAYSPVRSPAWRVGGSRSGRCLDLADHDYDLLVLNAALLRDHDWHWPINLKTQFLRQGGKVALIEGGDGWNEINLPPFPVDAVFRREIALGVDYGPVRHLTFAAPARWLPGSDRPERTWDIFNANSYPSNATRWDAASWMFRSSRRHFSLACTGGLPLDHYFNCMRDSRLAICCAGGGDSDCMRFAEAPACGAIPIFVGVPQKIRENWFEPEEHAFFCGAPDELPAVIDRALGMDLHAMRVRLLQHVWKYGTTAAMARRILQAVGMA